MGILTSSSKRFEDNQSRGLDEARVDALSTQSKNLPVFVKHHIEFVSYGNK